MQIKRSNIRMSKTKRKCKKNSGGTNNTQLARPTLLLTPTVTPITPTLKIPQSASIDVDLIIDNDTTLNCGKSFCSRVKYNTNNCVIKSILKTSNGYENEKRVIDILLKQKQTGFPYIYNSYNDDDFFAYIMTYYTDGDLISYILNQQKEQKVLTYEQIRRFSIDILNALNFLHDKNIIHGDVKPENMMMVNEKQNLELIDFDESRQTDIQYQKLGGTVGYMAPECFHNNITPNIEMDIFSFGCVLYVMLESRNAYNDDDTTKTQMIQYRGERAADETTITDDQLKKLRAIIQDTQNVATELRPTGAQIIQQLQNV